MRATDACGLACLLSFTVIAASLPMWSQQANAKRVPIEVRELVEGGSKDTSQLIAVHGCLVHEFEITVLQPCDAKFDQFSKYSIWLDDISEVASEASSTKVGTLIPPQSDEVLRNGRGDLWKLHSTRQHPISVVVEGQFQTARLRRYGHLGAYSHRLIVHRLLKHED